MLKTDVVEKRNNSNNPRHIAIICDGNGRWAKNRKLPRSIGHKEGAKPIETITKACNKLGVEALTFYVFSNENWNRPAREVKFLMKLFKNFFIRLQKEAGSKIRVKHIGRLENLPEELIQQIKKTEKITENNDGMILNIALNYSSRLEIIDAAKSIVKAELNKTINEEVMNNFMYTSDSPDLDLIIRTSGEKRISNFLLWQAASAKLWITEDLWPDFTTSHLDTAIEYYRSVM